MEQQLAYSYIRFSTKEQKKGTSYQRQYADTVKYCEEHKPKLILDKRLSFSDLGVAAFKGLNREKGELGVFLDLVEKGKIPRGSVLIVENLDRLSRENVLVALNQFTSIIKAGITLVTLMDRMEYSEKGIDDNWAQLIISITYMAKAYKESKDKSDRGKSTWNIKRKEISKEKKLTSKAPLWLDPIRIKISDTRYKTTGFTQNKDACKAIKRIFIMKQTMGNERIARELNQDDKVWKPPYNKKRKSEGWRGSYISKILTNREVIGEFTLYEKVNGRRVPIKTIPNYYPNAIKENLFFKVQKLMDKRGEENGNGGGMTGKAKNLFKNVVKCGLCGKPMHYIDKGLLPKGGTYLHCDSSRRKLMTINCTAKPVRYDEFEKLFFDSFEKETQDILLRLFPNEDKQTIRIDEIEDEISANDREIEKLDSKITILTEHLTEKASPKTKERYELANRKMIHDIELLEEKNRKLGIEINLLKDQGEDLKKDLNQIKEIYDLLNSLSSDQERIDTRHKLNLEILRMFEWIKIYPLQEPYQEFKEIEPGIVQTMNSKFIDKVTYKLRDVPLGKFLGKSLKVHGVLLEKSFIDIGNESLESLLSQQP